MARVLILDDDQNRHELYRACFKMLAERKVMKWEVVSVETAAACISKLAEHWDMILLDHDLGGKVFVDTQSEDCGTRVAEFISNNPDCVTGVSMICVHSLNPAGAEKMYNLLMGAALNLRDTKGVSAPAILRVPGLYLPDKFFSVIA